MPRFAAIQMEPILQQTEQNLEKVITLISEAAEGGAQLAVFPECTSTGYSLTSEEAQALAEPVPGPSTSRIVDACKKSGLIVSIGLLEKDAGGRCFNSVVLLNGEGILGKYRKTHLPYLGVDRYLTPGDKIDGPFDTLHGKIGMLICYDLRFPEPIRALALQGAQVILLSTAWPDKASFYPEFMGQSRSTENGLYLVAANRIGEERGTRYLGRSIICGPDGAMLAEGSPDDEEILYAEIDLARSANKKRVFIPDEYEIDLFADRRPDLYHALIE